MGNFKTYLGLYNCNTAKYGAIFYVLVEIIAMRNVGIVPNKDCYDMLEEIALNDLVLKRYDNTYEMVEKLLHECYNLKQIIARPLSVIEMFNTIKEESKSVAFYKVSPEEVVLLKEITKNILLKAVNIVKKLDYTTNKKYMKDEINKDLTVFMKLPLSSIETIYDEEDIVTKVGHFVYSLKQFFIYHEIRVGISLICNMEKQILDINIDWI